MKNTDSIVINRNHIDYNIDIDSIDSRDGDTILMELEAIFVFKPAHVQQLMKILHFVDEDALRKYMKSFFSIYRLGMLTYKQNELHNLRGEATFHDVY